MRVRDYASEAVGGHMPMDAVVMSALNPSPPPLESEAMYAQPACVAGAANKASSRAAKAADAEIARRQAVADVAHAERAVKSRPEAGS